mgnify:FL=1
MDKHHSAYSKESEVTLNTANHSAGGSGNIRKRSDGRWEGRYSVGFDPKTGKQIQKSIYGKTQKDVRQRLSQITVDIDTGEYIEPCKMTLNEWFDIWLQDYLVGVKASTAYLYERRVDLYLRPALGKIRMDQLNPHVIQHLYNELGKEHDGKKPLSAKTIKNIHGLLHKCLQQAVLLDYLKSNPSNACVLPKVVNKKINPLTDEQVKLFLKEIEGNKYELLFKVFLFTGLREAELLGLKWDCVNFNEGTILIDKQLNKSQKKGGKYMFTPPKNNKSRTLNPAPFVMNLLKEQKKLQDEMRQTAGPAWEESGLVFTNEFGRYMSYRAVYDEFKKRVTAIGYPEIRVHDLRHTYAVNSLRAGDDIKTLQENMGHATAAFTLDVYGHYTNDMRRASASRMEDFISSNFNL